MAMPSGRFFGWVIGGTLPAALGADWLTSAWDQNAGMRSPHRAWRRRRRRPGAGCSTCSGCRPDPPSASPPARRWPTSPAWRPPASTCWPAPVGTSSGSGWSGGPKVAVLVGAERHDSVDLALRYLGLGAPTPVAADDQGRDRAGRARRRPSRPSTGRRSWCCRRATSTPAPTTRSRECIALAHDHGAWVHVDGAFGLWAAASPALRHLVAGVDGRRLVGDRRPQDPERRRTTAASASSRDPSALQAAMACTADYLIQRRRRPDPFDQVPELSRRARGVPVVGGAARPRPHRRRATWSSGSPRHARAFAAGVADVPGAEVLNDVVFTQVCARVRRRRTHPGGDRSGCSPTGRPGCPGPGGTGATCCGSR